MKYLLILLLFAGGCGKDEQSNYRQEARFYESARRETFGKLLKCEASYDFQYMQHHRAFIRKMIAKDRCDKRWSYKHNDSVIWYCDIEGYVFVDDGSLVAESQEVMLEAAQ